MRNDNWLKGELLFKLAYRRKDEPHFYLSDIFFKNKEDAEKWANGCEFFWPAEDLDGVIFCPDPEELESKQALGGDK